MGGDYYKITYLIVDYSVSCPFEETEYLTRQIEISREPCYVSEYDSDSEDDLSRTIKEEMEDIMEANPPKILFDTQLPAAGGYPLEGEWLITSKSKQQSYTNIIDYALDIKKEGWVKKVIKITKKVECYERM